MFAAIGQIVTLAEERAAWARRFSRLPVRLSPTLNLVWDALDRRLANRISAERLSLLSYRKEGGAAKDFAAQGPPTHVRDEAELLDRLAEVWFQSSRQLDRLSRANGIQYFHFLQPNQYVAGSKPMAAEEKAVALPAAPAGLRRAGLGGVMAWGRA